MGYVTIDLALGFDDIDKILDVSEFLVNYPELIKKFEPEVTKFLVKKDFFKGPFLREYNKQFDQLICSLIKKELINHFSSYTPEDILILTSDIDFLKMLAQELFDQESYRNKPLT